MESATRVIMWANIDGPRSFFKLHNSGTPACTVEKREVEEEGVRRRGRERGREKGEGGRRLFFHMTLLFADLSPLPVGR